MKRLQCTILTGAITLSSLVFTGCSFLQPAAQPSSAKTSQTEQTGKAPENMPEISDGSGESSSKLAKDYYSLLIDTTDSEELYAFIDKNFEASTPEDMSRYVIGLTGFYTYPSELDYERLLTYREKMSDELAQYIDNRIAEQKTSFVSDNQVTASLDTLLSEALVWEKQLNDFPEGFLQSFSFESYSEYIRLALTGLPGLSAEERPENSVFLNKGTDEVSESSLKTYRDFIESNPDTQTGKVIKNYLDALEKSKNKVDTSINNFYLDISGELSSYFELNF